MDKDLYEAYLGLAICCFKDGDSEKALTCLDTGLNALSNKVDLIF